MTELLNIHTHHPSANPAQEILNRFPHEFMPHPGGYYSVGIHPRNVSGKEDWAAIESIVAHPQVLAVGEAGPDKTSTTPWPLQIECFKQQIILADKINKPLIIHAVRSLNEVIQLKKTFCPRNPWIVHGFRGSPESALQLVAHNIRLSFGKKYREEAIRVVPIKYLFMETDDDTDADIVSIYHRAAHCVSLSFDELVAQVKQNIHNVFF